jgi:hypothetical protein
MGTWTRKRMLKSHSNAIQMPLKSHSKYVLVAFNGISMAF